MKPAHHVDFEHTGPDTPAGKLLRRYWQPVFVSRELKIAHPVPIRLLSEEFTIYRGEDGIVRAVEARCPHRGLHLSVGKVEGSSIRCRYHGWNFDESGQCTEQPFERKCFAAKVKIQSYPVQEYFGLVWMYIGEGPAPALPRWPALEKFGFFHVVELRKWNYFHDLENTVDDVHQRWVHKEGVYQDAQNADQIPTTSAVETEFGLMQFTTFENGFLRKLALFMPNMLYFTAGAGPLRGYKGFLWNVPVDDENHKMYFLFVATHMSPALGKFVSFGMRTVNAFAHRFLTPVEKVVQSVLSGRKRWEDLRWRPDLVLVEDGIILMGQGTIPNRAKNRLGSSDAAIILLRKIYGREMAAINEGRPGRAFTQPGISELAAVDAMDSAASIPAAKYRQFEKSLQDEDGGVDAKQGQEEELQV
jgi:5,5'-dehydrodivanillate O-demethylase